MQKTSNLDLLLYEPNDKFHITSENNSLNKNFKIIDTAISTKVGYAEQLNGSLNLYADSSKTNLIATVALPTSGSSGSGLTESQVRNIITSYGYGIASNYYTKAESDGKYSTKEELLDVVEEYFREHPVTGVTPSQIASAVEAYLTEHPVEGGVTEEYVNQVVNQFANGALQQVGQMLESYPTTEQADARYAFKGESGSADPYFSVAMFQKIGIIGDSFASGTIHRPPVETAESEYYGKPEELAWGSAMARRNGAECKLFTKAGISAKTYIADRYCLSALESDASTAPCGLYWFGLGLNDAPLYKADNSYMGTVADCDASERVDTFYGNCGWIIRRIKAIAPRSKIVVASIIGYMRTISAENMAINTALSNIANHFGLPFITLLDDEFYHSDFYYNTMYGKHPTSIVYSGMSLANERLLAECVKNHGSYFWDYVRPVVGSGEEDDPSIPEQGGDSGDATDENLVYNLDRTVFDGSNYVDTGLKLYNDITTDYTIVMKMEIPADGQYNMIPMACWSPTSPYHGIQLTAGNATAVKRYIIYNATTKNIFDFADTTAKIVIMRKNGTHYAYRDGDTTPFYTLSDAVPTHDNTLTFGARKYRTDPESYWKGAITAKVYNVAFTDEQITDAFATM